LSSRIASVSMSQACNGDVISQRMDELGELLWDFVGRNAYFLRFGLWWLL
jgi:hypothetical protein